MLFEDCCYKLIGGNGAMIEKYCGNCETVRIPAQINGHPVEKIGGFAFAYNEMVKTVVLPEGVDEICIGAFEDCTALCSVSIPQSVKLIGERAFAGCSSLLSVSIPAVQEIEDEAFQNCSALQAVDFQEGLEIIGWNVFENCTALQQIRLPDSVATMGDAVFSGCSSLRSCNIPNAIEYMGYQMFENCHDLVLSITPGNFREGYAERFALPFVMQKDNDVSSQEKKETLQELVYEIVVHYRDYKQQAGILPDIPVKLQEERPAPWKKENGIWCMYPGFLTTIWKFDFPEHYVRDHQREALLRAIFYPGTEITLAYSGTTHVSNTPFPFRKFPQIQLNEDVKSICLNPDGKYGSVTTWIAVSDSQIAVAKQFWYD